MDFEVPKFTGFNSEIGRVPYNLQNKVWALGPLRRLKWSRCNVFVLSPQGMFHANVCTHLTGFMRIFVQNCNCSYILLFSAPSQWDHIKLSMFLLRILESLCYNLVSIYWRNARLSQTAMSQQHTSRYAHTSRGKSRSVWRRHLTSDLQLLPDPVINHWPLLTVRFLKISLSRV